MTSRAPLVAIALASLGAGCEAKPLATAEAAPTNACRSDADCGGGSCGAGICQARQGEIGSVIVEVTPDPAASSGTLTPFYVALQSVAGGAAGREIALPEPSRVVGSVKLKDAQAPNNKCLYAAGVDQSIAAHVELVRSDAILGLPSVPFATNAAQPKDAPAGAPWSFAVDLVPGTYDVYVRPPEKATCPVAPLFLPGVVVAPGDNAFGLEIGAPSVLEGTVKPPGGLSLAGWTVDVIEPKRGRVVSTRVPLSPGVTNFTVEYHYGPATQQKLGGAKPYLRIAPPKGLTAPTVLYSLDGLLDGNALDMSDVPTKAVTVQARVVAPGAPAGTPVALAFDLAGPKGALVVHNKTVPAKSGVPFDVSLLEGTYRVVAVPDDPTLATTVSEWQVAAAGAPPERAILVQARAKLDGSARWPSGAPAAGVPASATETHQAADLDVLDAVLGKLPVVPRPAGTTTGEDGTFSLALDPGRFDVAVRPDAASGFPWALRLDLLVGPGTAEAPPPLVSRVGLPVVVSGRIVDPAKQPVRGALVRAYAPLAGEQGQPRPTDVDQGDANKVVQVAETRTDAAGQVRLLLPARLDR